MSLPISDQRAIHSVIIRYATAIDQKDWSLFRSCFSENAVADYGPIGRWEDMDTFTRDFDEMHRVFERSLHRMSNIAFIGDDDSAARTRTYVDVILTWKDKDDAPVRACGFYEDDWVQEDDAWKIQQRVYTMVHEFQ